MSQQSPCSLCLLLPSHPHPARPPLGPCSVLILCCPQRCAPGAALPLLSLANTSALFATPGADAGRRHLERTARSSSQSRWNLERGQWLITVRTTSISVSLGFAVPVCVPAHVCRSARRELGAAPKATPLCEQGVEQGAHVGCTGQEQAPVSSRAPGTPLQCTSAPEAQVAQCSCLSFVLVLPLLGWTPACLGEGLRLTASRMGTPASTGCGGGSDNKNNDMKTRQSLEQQPHQGR